MTVSQSDFDTKLSSLVDAYKTKSALDAKFIADVTTAFNALRQKIAILQASSSGVDLTNEMNQIDTLLTSVTSDTAAETSADAAATIEAQ